MAYTVYLSNTDIEVVKGQSNGKAVSVSHVYSEQMPEGSFLNGVITDPEGVEYALSGMWNKYKLPKKGIRLVINTPQISVRVIDMPIMSQSKADIYLQREFEERSGERKRLLGFYVISRNKKNKTMKVCTELADVDFIANYVNVFAGAGITLTEINSGIGVSVNFLKRLSFANDTNCVVMLRDGMTVTAIYLVKGEYFYSTTTRTFNNPGTLEFASEISNTVSQIEQFSKSQNVEDSISQIYLGGMTIEDSTNVERAVAMNLSENITVFNISVMRGVSFSYSTDSLDALFYPTAGIMTLSEHWNLLKMYGKGEIIDTTKRSKIIYLVIPYVAAFVIMLGITVSRSISYSNKKRELQELKDYNTNISNIMGAAEYDEAASKVSLYSDHVNGLRLLEKNIDSYPFPTSEIEKIIEGAALGLGDVTVNNYNADKGVVGITARFSEVDTVNTFIDRLNDNNCFYEINYTGYSEINSSGQWVANLECILSEDAGR